MLIIMKRKYVAIFLILALIFTFPACTALQRSTEKDRIIKEHESNGSTADDKNMVEEESTDTPDDPDDNDDSPWNDSQDNIKGIIKKRSMDVLKAIKKYDLKRLADAVHPDKGVRFSPYGYVDVENHLVFTAEKVKNLATDSKTYLWGYYDATGQPINLTFENYYRKFIYDVDFVNAEQVATTKSWGMETHLTTSPRFIRILSLLNITFQALIPSMGVWIGEASDSYLKKRMMSGILWGLFMISGHLRLMICSYKGLWRCFRSPFITTPIYILHFYYLLKPRKKLCRISTHRFNEAGDYNSPPYVKLGTCHL